MTVQSAIVHDPAKRTRLIESAAVMFARLGFERAGVDEIAAGADVAKGTVYLYFANKADLFRAVLSELQERIEIRDESNSSDDPAKLLREVVRAQFKVAAEAPDLFRCYLSALFGVNRDFQAAALAIFDRQKSHLTRVLDAHAGRSRKTTANEHRASLFLSSVLAAGLVSALEGRDNMASRDEDALVSLALPG